MKAGLAEGDGFRHCIMLFQGFLLELTAANGLLKTMKAFFFLWPRGWRWCCWIRLASSAAGTPQLAP